MIAVAIIWSARRTDKNGLALERRIALSVGDIALDHFDASFRRARWSGKPLREALPTLVRNIDTQHAFDVVGLLEAGETEPEIIATRDTGYPQIHAIARQAIASGLRRQAATAASARLPGRAYLLAGRHVVLMIATPAAGGTTAFAFRVLDAGMLTALGAAAGLRHLHLTVDPENYDSDNLATLPNGPEAVAAALSWEPRRSGQAMLHDVLPVVIFGACLLLLFSILIFMRIRKVIVEMLVAEQHAKHLAGHDSLTGLANRASFMEQLRRELVRLRRDNGSLAVMFIDLDKFKDVNDTLGHGAGDRLLVNVAQRLSAQLRGADTLARLGGDEFAVVQTQVRNISDTEALARRLLAALQAPFDLDGREAYVGVSIGIVMSPANGGIAEELIRHADVALYRSKSEGRNRFSFFETRMDASARMRNLVENDLRRAIENDELTLHYQPQVAADASRIVAMEALVRWDHPAHGQIAPGEFISLAEERGLIVPLGEWVLRRALSDARAWPGMTISINVSAVQFKQRDFVATVARIIEETGFDPSLLEIELTESVVVQDADGAEDAIVELRAMGVRLALDDFGTGYSSLIYLRRFAFDKIKIDKSFLESMEATGESAILVHSVVHLGRALGLTVIAEGVETEEQRRFLQAVGCHQLQGFLFSKPVPAADVARLLEIGHLRPKAA